MSSIPFSHVSVLLSECIEALDIRDGYTYVDCTTGGGGHSLEIAKRLGPNSRLICFDRDENAITAAKERLKDHLDKITFINSNFSELDKVIEEYGITNLGGVLADLGGVLLGGLLVDVKQRDLGAVCGKCLGKLAADDAARTGDGDHLV